MAALSPPLEALRRAASGDLLPPGRPVLVACSGGLDSMSLVRAMLLAGRWPLRAATVDHGLRTDSAADAGFVSRTLARWNVPVAVLRADPERVRAGEGPEDGARRERYRLLEEHAAAIGVERLVTAHTADDQAETLLMRLATGAGARGMAGIPERRGPVVRPWLGVTRAEVAAFAHAHGVPWQEDPTNAGDAFLRNRVRRAVAPGLGGVFGEGWVRAAARTGAHVRGDLEALDYLIDRWREEVSSRRGEGVEIDLARYAAAPPGLRRRLLFETLVEVSRRSARPLRSIERHVDRLEGLAGAGVGATRIGLPAGLEARRAYGRLVIGVPPPRPEPAPPTVVTGPGRWSWGRWTLVVEALEALPAPEHRGDACLDRDGAPFPWTVRPVARGEVYRPLGAPGSRRVSRLLIDARVDRDLRPALPAVEAAGRLAWVAPLRVAEAARVRPGAAAWRVRLMPVDESAGRWSRDGGVSPKMKER